MTRILPIAALLVVTGCGQSQESTAPVANETASAPSSEVSKSAVPSMAGNWRVTMIDGGDASALAMSAMLEGGQASLATGCFRRAWTYTQQRNAVTFTTSPSGSSNCGGQAPGADEESAYAAVDGANIVIFNKDGKEASLSGTGGTLTLERR